MNTTRYIVMEKGILLVLCILVIIKNHKNCQQGTFYFT